MLSSRFNLMGTVSYDSDSSNSSVSTKVVGTCMNCSYSYRLSSSGNAEFCSKDCQTCYLIYISNPAHTPRQKMKINFRSNKQLVYDFQREVDARDARSSDREEMVDVNELQDGSADTTPIMIEIPKSPKVRLNRQPTTPMRPLH